MKFALGHAPVWMQRGEALLLGREFVRAMAIFRQWHSPESAPQIAKRVAAEVLAGETVSGFPEALEPQVSQEFLRWYRELLRVEATAVVEDIHARLEPLARVLPSAAVFLEAALAEARAA